jgi:RNA polymerase sigma-70 factor, ECF subfamily
MKRNPDELTDERIAGRVLEGTIDLFSEIIHRYENRVFAIGMKFFKNRDDAADFTQEVFIKVYNSLGSFRGESRFYSWLIRVAYNHGINAARTTRPSDSLAEEYIEGRELSPEQAHLRGEICTALREAVRQLPGEYRVCMDFYFFFGLSYREIGEITGFPVNTIKSHVFRAKRILRDELRGTIAEAYDEV